MAAPSPPAVVIWVDALASRRPARRTTSTTDLVDGGDDLVLERVGERQRHAGRRDPADRCVEQLEPLVGDDRRRPSRPIRPGTGSPRRSASREVFATEASTVATSSGTRQRRSRTSASMPSRGQLLGGGQRDRHRRGERHERDVGALADDRGLRPAARRGPAGPARPCSRTGPCARRRPPGRRCGSPTPSGRRRRRASTGATIFSPGTVSAQFSTACECCAPKPRPPPFAVRITSGTVTWPPVM